MFYPALGYFESLFCLQTFNSAVSLSPFPSICVDFPFAKGLLSQAIKFGTKWQGEDGYTCICFCGG